MKYLLTIFFYLLSILGCQSNLTAKWPQNKKLIKYVHLDPQFSKIEKQIIENAFYDWNKQTNGFVQWEFRDWPPFGTDSNPRLPEETDDNCFSHIMVLRMFSSDRWVINIELAIGHSIAGYADTAKNKCDTDYILLVMDQIHNVHQLKLVSLHEIGHNLGLRHNGTPGSIMNDKKLFVSVTGISASDLRTLSELYD